jgi:hypothetical protein
MTVVGARSRRPSRSALTAAAARRTLERGAGRDWSPVDDRQLWEIYDRLGEVGYGVGFKSHAAQRLSYFVGVRPGQDQDPDPDLAGPQAIEALEALNGDIGGVPDIVAELVTHLDVVGEGWLVGQTVDDSEEWDVWSSSEMQRSKTRTPALYPDGAEITGDEAVAIRIWRPHPRDRAMADAPLRRVAAECEQLILLSDMLTSFTRSRLAAPLLFIPDELSFGGTGNLPGTGGNAGDDPFTEELIQLMTTAVSDSRSAARIVPGLIRGPGERGAEIRVIDITRDLPADITTVQERVVRRIAAGMDIPAEVLTGLADVNHWTAWQVDESAYRQHVDPVVLLVLDSITRGYLWPRLEEAGVANARDHVIWRDFSDLVAKQGTVVDAIRLYDRGAVGAEYLRRIGGANEADAPTPEDLDRLLAMRGRRGETAEGGEEPPRSFTRGTRGGRCHRRRRTCADHHHLGSVGRHRPGAVRAGIGSLPGRRRSGARAGR